MRNHSRVSSFLPVYVQYTEARDTASVTCAIILARSTACQTAAKLDAHAQCSAPQRSGSRCGARAVLCHAVARATLLFRDNASKRGDVRLSDSTFMLIATADAVWSGRSAQVERAEPTSTGTCRTTHCSRKSSSPWCLFPP